MPPYMETNTEPTYDVTLLAQGNGNGWATPGKGGSTLKRVTGDCIAFFNKGICAIPDCG